MSIDYYRLLRHHQPRTLSITVSPDSVQNGEVQIWLDRSYADKFGLENIVPDPESTDLEPDRVVYTFTTGQADGPLTVTFTYKHDGFWHPMDSSRDYKHLNDLWAHGAAPWNTWDPPRARIAA